MARPYVPSQRELEKRQLGEIIQWMDQLIIRLSIRFTCDDGRTLYACKLCNTTRAAHWSEIIHDPNCNLKDMWTKRTQLADMVVGRILGLPPAQPLNTYDIELDEGDQGEQT